MRTKCVLVVFLLMIPCVSQSFAEYYSRLGLPEGAIARFGKGEISDITYSNDAAVNGDGGVNIQDLVLVRRHSEMKTVRPLP